LKPGKGKTSNRGAEGEKVAGGPGKKTLKRGGGGTRQFECFEGEGARVSKLKGLGRSSRKTGGLGVFKWVKGGAKGASKNKGATQGLINRKRIGKLFSKTHKNSEGYFK